MSIDRVPSSDLPVCKKCSLTARQPHRQVLICPECGYQHASEIRIDRLRLLSILRNAGILAPTIDAQRVDIRIVWENHSTESLFDPVHGADGLSIMISEEV